MLDYDDYQRSLSALDSSVDCAEAHGILCGILCLDANSASSEWLGIEDDGSNRLFEKSLSHETGGNATDDSAIARLVQLHRLTQQQLTDTNYSFSPLLPDDSHPLEERTRSLCHWCQGFLYGLSISGLKTLDTLPAASREIVEDFSAIAQLEDSVEDSEEDESAYTELVEYLRVGTFTLFDEHNTPPAGATLH